MQKPSMLGRPENNKAGAYYFTYIDRISGTDAVGTIENQLDASWRSFRKYPKQNRCTNTLLKNGVSVRF